MYSLLSLPKIFNKLILFVFFISVFFTLSKYEENNEILIFWTYGIKKTEFINKLVKFSILFFLFNLILSFFVVPKTQDLAKSYIRDSSIDFFPSLIKTEHFNDTAKDLTIFVENKNQDGLIKNIFIKENHKDNSSQIISAKEGWLAKKKNNYYLILYNGNIINLDEKNTNIIEFKKSEFNLSKYGTKSTIFPKMQETNSLKLIQCLNSFVNYNTADEFNLGFMEQFFKCDKTSINSVFQEVYKRLILPFYIIVSAFIAGCLVIKSKTQFDFFKYKSAIFILGFIFIVFSEASSNFLTYLNLYKSAIVLFPFMIIIAIYSIINISKKNKSI